MTLRGHLDADQMRSLEDTMKYDLGLAGVISNGNSSIDYADERPSPFGFSPGQMETTSERQLNLRV